jgi:hypothetical protein
MGISFYAEVAQALQNRNVYIDEGNQGSFYSLGSRPGPAVH